MFLKKLAIVTVGAATLSACAQPVTSSFEAARQQGLLVAPISRGACDSLGQLIPGTDRSDVLTLGTRPVTLEASAAPTHGE